MAKEYIISPVSSLNFDHGWKLGIQREADYIQKFLRTDQIRVQVCAYYPFDVAAVLRNLTDGTASAVTAHMRSAVGMMRYHEVEMTGLAANKTYALEFILTGGSVTLETTSEPFAVFEELKDTVLLTYTNRRDEADTVFSPGRLWEFRVEGVLLPGEAQFLADTEDFRDQRYTQRQLSADTYRKDVLSVGATRAVSCGDTGVPNWVGEKLNNIFALSSVLIDGRKYVRSEGSAPAITEILPAYPLFVYKMEVEKDKYHGQGMLVIKPDEIALAAESPTATVTVYSTDNWSYVSTQGAAVAYPPVPAGGGPGETIVRFTRRTTLGTGVYIFHNHSTGQEATVTVTNQNIIRDFNDDFNNDF